MPYYHFLDFINESYFKLLARNLPQITLKNLYFVLTRGSTSVNKTNDVNKKLIILKCLFHGKLCMPGFIDAIIVSQGKLESGLNTNFEDLENTQFGLGLEHPYYRMKEQLF